MLCFKKYICAQAKNEPVFEEIDGLINSVILSAQQFEALKSAEQSKTIGERCNAFHQTHKDRIKEQNARFEKNGLWCRAKA